MTDYEQAAHNAATILDALQACTEALEHAEVWARAGDPTARLDALWAVVPMLIALIEQLGSAINSPAPAPGDTPPRRRCLARACAVDDG